MPLPDPRPGLVVRYAFLWSREHGQGATEAAKDRPCAILVARRVADTGATLVAVLPITHTPPGTSPAGGAAAHLKLTARECQNVGLDGADHWVVLNEVNRFTWPGYDLRTIPGTDRYDYGGLPRATFERIVKALVALDAARKAAKRPATRPVDRDG